MGEFVGPHFDKNDHLSYWRYFAFIKNNCQILNLNIFYFTGCRISWCKCSADTWSWHSSAFYAFSDNLLSLRFLDTMQSAFEGDTLLCLLMVSTLASTDFPSKCNEKGGELSNCSRVRYPIKVSIFFNPFNPKSDQLQFSLSVIYSMENLAIDSLLRWKLIEQLFLTTSLNNFSLNGWENLDYELGIEKVTS